MDDLISREAVIDALNELGGVGGIYLFDPEKVFEAVGSVPSSVVRCQECKYAHLTANNEAKYCDMWSDGDELYLSPDFFCAYGERRGDHAAD